MTTKKVAWFSCGVSSAVAIKLAIDDIDEIVYTHIDDQHPDSMRFLHDCEEWFGREITVMQSPYKNVEAACMSLSFIRQARGANQCTKVLKKRVRKEWEASQGVPLVYYWGLDFDETGRADRLFDSMPEFGHVFPLIERKITKKISHEILRASGIKRPAMYDLGYHNNNCIGCVKGGMGYWNKIRVDFPEVFEARAKLERLLGSHCLSGCYLDELDPEAGRHAGPIVGSCGIMCEIMKID
jgi:hypothetical protein